MSHRNALAIAAPALLVLAGCADPGAPDPAPAAEGGSPTPATPSAAAPLRDAPTQKAEAAPQGDCDLLTAAEISAAFGGKLSVRRAGGHGPRGGSCTWSLAEVAESELVLQAGDASAYAARKDAYTSQSGIAIEPLALGKEALLVNRAQVIALREDGRSISLGLMLIVFNTPMPASEDEIRSGLEMLAGIALERL